MTYGYIFLSCSSSLLVGMFIIETDELHGTSCKHNVFRALVPSTVI